MLNIDMETTLASMIVCRSNLQVLHWKAKGNNFDTQHKIAEDLISLIDPMIDDLAELLVSRNNRAVNILSAVVLNKKQNEAFDALNPTLDYDYEISVSLINNMFNFIISKLTIISNEAKKEIYDPNYISPVIEDMIVKLGKQVNYLNSRRV